MVKLFFALPKKNTAFYHGFLWVSDKVKPANLIMYSEVKVRSDLQFPSPKILEHQHFTCD